MFDECNRGFHQTHHDDAAESIKLPVYYYHLLIWRVYTKKKKKKAVQLFFLFLFIIYILFIEHVSDR